MWIQTGVTVRKRLSWVLTSVTLTFDLWPWPFAWTSLLSLVITPVNFMMIRWWEHSQKGVTDGRMDGKYHSLSCLVAAKNNRAPLLCYFKLCAAFHSHQWIQTGVTVQKCQIRVKIDNIFKVSPWNLTNDLEKQIGHLFYATSNFVHQFITIGEFKLKFKCGNAQFGSKSTIFRAVWPCN